MISKILEYGLKRDPNKIAIFEQDDFYTYEELDEYVGKLAQGMKDQLCLKEHDVLAMMSSNTIEYIFTLFACWRLGVTLTPMNPALKPDEIKYQLENSNAKVFIYEGYCADKAKEAVAKMENKPSMFVFRGEPTRSEARFTELFSYEKYEARDVSLDTLALLIYTSGTTGKPKGVMLTHQNVLAAIEGFSEFLRLDESDRSYLILPLFHVNSIHLTLSAPLSKGGSVVLTNRFKAESFVINVARYKPTYTIGVPTVFRMLDELPEEQIRSYDLSSLKFALCGGAPFTVAEFEKIQKKFPFKILEAYGLSEATVCSTSNPIDGKHKVGSIGIPLPGQQVKIIDEQGVELSPYEKGELLIKGKVVMKGYLNDEVKTKETIKDGWLYTGDIAYQDEDGYLYIVDRKKEMIIRGGINIYPKEIEQVIYELPYIKEVAIVGVPDEKYGEEVVGYVAVYENTQVTEAEIINYCKQKIANYRCPKRIYFLDSLPKNSVGKISKHKLVELSKKDESMNL